MNIIDKQKETNKFKIYADLYLAFFRIGALSFGGGISMLPMIIKECKDRYKWATEEELLSYFALGQCTPGVIAVNVSTFIGFKQKRWMGALVSTLGMISPSLVIISIIAWVLEPFMKYKIVLSAFIGVRIAISALLLHTFVYLLKQSIKDKFGVFVFLVGIMLSLFLPIPIIIIVLIAALMGMAYELIINKEKNK